MSAYKTLNFAITGVSPLIMRNGQTADPLNQHSQSIAEITSKRKKTEADHREVARREFFAGLYIHHGEPCIPGEMIEAVLVNGAKKEKRGPAAKAGIIVEANAPLQYKGPRKPSDLWDDERFRLRVPVRVGTSKIIRTRPRFNDWCVDLEIRFLPSLLNEREIRSFLVTAGEQIGIGDWRPRFGRFSVS